MVIVASFMSLWKVRLDDQNFVTVSDHFAGSPSLCDISYHCQFNRFRVRVVIHLVMGQESQGDGHRIQVFMNNGCRCPCRRRLDVLVSRQVIANFVIYKSLFSLEPTGMLFGISTILTFSADKLFQDDVIWTPISFVTGSLNDSKVAIT